MLAVKRKLIDLGGSVVVALPLEWIRARGLKAGDSVRIVVSESAIIVDPLDSQGRPN